MTARPVRIGVTGGMAAGKSTVAREFERHGAAVFSADAAVHALYEDPAVRAAIIDHFGDRVARDDGSIDRSAIAAIVFADESERKWLEALLHPLVARSWLKAVEKIEQQDPPPPMIVAEVPLLFEAGLEDRYDVIVAVVAPYDLRHERAEQRGDYPVDVKRRSQQQLSQAEKAERATHVIVNDGDRAALATAVDALVEQVI